MLSALCYALYKPCRGWRPRQPAPVCLLNPAITPQMAVGANSVRPPLFAYMVCTNSTSRNSSKRDVVFLQSRNCAAPLQVFVQVSAAAKSLRSLRIYVLLWDRIAVQIVLLRYFFCLISYFYMLLILQSAPSRLSPNEALPHTPLGTLPLDPTSPPAPSLSVRFIYRFARCLGSALPIPHSSLPPLLT